MACLEAFMAGALELPLPQPPSATPAGGAGPSPPGSWPIPLVPLRRGSSRTSRGSGGSDADDYQPAQAAPPASGGGRRRSASVYAEAEALACHHAAVAMAAGSGSGSGSGSGTSLSSFSSNPGSIATEQPWRSANAAFSSSSPILD